MKENGRPRGRPRTFDRAEAVRIGRRLFHEHGYEQVGLAALTDAIGISPPSFYAAFGSKAAFFERVLRDCSSSVLPLDEILTPGRAPADAVRALLLGAARAYASDAAARGCLIIEHGRADGHARTDWGRATVAELRRNRDRLRVFVAATFPDAAPLVADLVAATMSGMSAEARLGWDEARLVAVARLTADTVDRLLAGA